MNSQKDSGTAVDSLQRKEIEPEYVLSLDASHSRGSVAVSCKEETLCEILFDASDTHSATLMPAMDFCLKSAKVSLGKIGLLVVVSGPGSFTGLRIALATAKGLAAARGIGVVTVTSLETLAAAFPYAARSVMPLIDARRGEVYGGVYSTCEGSPVELVPCFAARPEKIKDFIAAWASEPLILCGTGALRYREQLSRLLHHGSIFAPMRWSTPYASLAARIGLSRPELSKEELISLEPLYLRPPDARLPSNMRLFQGGDESR